MTSVRGLVIRRIDTDDVTTVYARIQVAEVVATDWRPSLNIWSEEVNPLRAHIVTVLEELWGR